MLLRVLAQADLLQLAWCHFSNISGYLHWIESNPLSGSGALCLSLHSIFCVLFFSFITSSLQPDSTSLVPIHSSIRLKVLPSPSSFPIPPRRPLPYFHPFTPLHTKLSTPCVSNPFPLSALSLSTPYSLSLLHILFGVATTFLPWCRLVFKTCLILIQRRSIPYVFWNIR